MKYKRYILFLIITMILGLNRAYAIPKNNLDCYYLSPTSKNIESVSVYVKDNKARVYKAGQKVWPKGDGRGEKILNYNKIGQIPLGSEHSVDVEKYIPTNSCPNYIVVYYKTAGVNELRVFAADDEQSKNEILNTVSNIPAKGFYAYAVGYNSSITKDIFFENYAKPCKYYGTCAGGGTSNPIPKQDVDCKTLFGSIDEDGTKDNNGDGEIDPPSIAYLINSVLLYVRIIVPILIILLGSLDLAKAVVAGKEDQMRKAQTTFFKRIVAGIIVFFVPTMVNLIMKLTDFIWNGMSYCNLP